MYMNVYILLNEMYGHKSLRTKSLTYKVNSLTCLFSWLKYLIYA